MTEFMPHAVTSDSHLLRWPRAPTSPRTLPRPPNTDDTASTKQSFVYQSGPPTPPPTSEMNGLPYSYPISQRLHEVSYPVRTHNGSASQQGINTYKQLAESTAEKYIKSSPPGISTLVQGEPQGRQSPSHNNAVTTAFRVPSSISAPQACLPQLAAETACLFWFESSITIQKIEAWTPGTPVPPNAISPNAVPSTAFQKWLTTLLATTQVTPNVIILALLFIYKLKSFNKRIKGGPNSEFKLMTVALMLGNKFLDDNTYTNKTWAEVSAIPVKDVHVMEVEFLSNMRYSLFTTEPQWSAWHRMLGKFGTYLDLAAKAREAALTRPILLTPTNAHFPHALPSPPNAFPQLSPSFQGNYSPSHLPQSSTPVLLPQPISSAISPIGPLPELEQRFNGRKRSFDDGAQEPPAKRRVLVNYHDQQFNLPIPTLSQPQPQISHPQVQLPSLPAPSFQHASQMQFAPQLPAPGSRSMALVYQQAPNSQQSQPQLPPPAAMTLSAPNSVSTSMAPLQTAALPPLPVLHPDHARQLSPYPGGSATNSPINTMYTPHSGQVSQRHSPSYFLQQRSSPYRPVRQVQTLVAPPSSTPLYNAPRLVSHDQMQYHPLGRPYSERRYGQLPYLNHEAWPQHHQFNQWSEVIPPPPPNFSQTQTPL